MAAGRRLRDPQERFEQIIRSDLDRLPKDECAIWPNATTGSGYGRFWMEGREYKAHVAAWMFIAERPARSATRSITNAASAPA